MWLMFRLHFRSGSRDGIKYHLPHVNMSRTFSGLIGLDEKDDNMFLLTSACGMSFL